MLHSLNRTLLMLVCLAYPTVLMAEVSDKEPGTVLFWQVGTGAALLCFLAARARPWLGAACFIPAMIWFITIFFEIHSSDVGPHLRLEQGDGYYLQAYAAFGIAISGLIAGYLWHKRRSS